MRFLGGRREAVLQLWEPSPREQLRSVRLVLTNTLACVDQLLLIARSEPEASGRQKVLDALLEVREVLAPGPVTGRAAVPVGRQS
ncbi:hypothetical protein [Actinoplanes regularis]|uniref:Uncharacterized protein n=1 Tax=Actinoplanes regularis TaxID=52697 RepID=A0A238WR17_9ACTN|nr:hypothetical protein [Actinoplanes regularis]GIE84585.1 hypothetical protein Are01nite_10650 [Actinoplanes regularis]SNR49050.1 hypothetical protein SAMN06264365_102827 [Actinoplanes regularis]